MSFVVVFGAGQVGSGLARALSARGHRVRVVRRSNVPVPGAEVVTGDARDRAFAAEVTAGASAIYHCMNPSAYTAVAWEAELLALGEALIGAAVTNDAKLVVLDCLYAYGEAERRSEDTPLAATGPKGRLRAAWDARLRAEPGLRYAVGRAGDFFGPGTEAHSLMSPAVVAGLAAGRSAWLIGDGAAPHAFSYVPDVVAGLVALGESDATGVWHLPVLEVPPAELVARLATATGSSARARVVPAWVVRALAPFVPLLRELRETLYQWDRPFLVDDRRFRSRFPEVGTSLEHAVAETVASTLPSGQSQSSDQAHPIGTPLSMK